jgi:hypothetical protein
VPEGSVRRPGDTVRITAQLNSTLRCPCRGQAALGSVESSKWPTDWTKTLEYFDRAIASDRHNATAYLLRGIA